MKWIFIQFKIITETTELVYLLSYWSSVKSVIYDMNTIVYNMFLCGDVQCSGDIKKIMKVITCITMYVVLKKSISSKLFCIFYDVL